MDKARMLQVSWKTKEERREQFFVSTWDKAVRLLCDMAILDDLRLGRWTAQRGYNRTEAGGRLSILDTYLAEDEDQARSSSGGDGRLGSSLVALVLARVVEVAHYYHEEAADTGMLLKNSGRDVGRVSCFPSALGCCFLWWLVWTELRSG